MESFKRENILSPRAGDRNRVQEAFSNSAKGYETLAGLQKEIGEKMLSRIGRISRCSSALDVGMGTGWLTARLNRLFPEANIVGLDFASGMVEYAAKKYGNFPVVQANALRLPFKPNTFDLIISNLAYQWVDDLSGAFLSCRELLKPGGKLCLTVFGEKTLQELFWCLDESWGKDREAGRLSIQRLADQERIIRCLRQAGFRSVESDSQLIRSHFADMLELVRWLKGIGANAAKRNAYMGKDLLFKAKDIYSRNFSSRSGVYATFEVIWIESEKE
ncbi:MAG: methyltransferase domain-containing protein [Candidatus Omnitrophota bacterium]